jgi:HK97 family phage portal protein
MANSFWQRVKGLFTDGGAEKSAQGLLAGVLQSGLAPRRGTRELLQAYRTHPWLHAVVHRIAGAVASEHFELFRSVKAAPTTAGKPPAKGLKRKHRLRQMRLTQTKGSVMYAPNDAVEIEDHPILNLLENPSPVFTRSMFFHLIQSFLETKGEAPIVIERDGAGLPCELWPVPPMWVAETPHRGFPFYRFSYGTWQRTIPEDDVIMLRHPELEQPYVRGVGFGESLADELDIDEFATKHLKSWFFNRALPDVFLSVEGVESKEEAIRYEEMLRQKHGGRNKAFQVHVTNGKVDVKQVGHTFREQMLPEIRTQSRDVVLQIFGMPPEIMGIVENSNRATIDAATLIFMKFLVVPRLSFLADAFTHWARRVYNDETLCVGFDSPIPEDEEFALKVMVAQPSLFTKNEWRELAGEEPVDGWDEEFVDKPAPPSFGPGLPGAPPADPNADPAKKPDANADGEDVIPDDAEAEKAASRGLLRLVSALGQ